MPDRASFVPHLRLAPLVRERMELAVLAMGADPARWREIAASTRRSLGAVTPEPGPDDPVLFVEEGWENGRRRLPVKALEEIGRGGFNTVYRTRDLVLDLPFAIRSRHSARSAAELEQYLIHDQVVDGPLKALPPHPVIPACFGRGRVGERPCELYAYAPGVNLRSYVARRGLTYGALLDVAFCGALGLRHLHQHGLVHADVKPDNFCVEERQLRDGRIGVRSFLIDFDIATTPEEIVQSYAVGTSFAGTPAYMPPESFAGVVPSDPFEREQMAYARDVYALGLTLFDLLTGGGLSGLPRPVRTTGGSIRVSAGRSVQLPASVPAPLRELVVTLSAEDWRDRPTSVDTVLAVRGLRRAATRSLLDHLVVEPRPRVRYPTYEEALAAGPSIGPYLVVNPAFEVRAGVADGAPGTIVELEDAWGRRLLGIPFAFAREEDAAAFYQDRCRLLEELNRVRRSNPELFSGTFSDLVRTEDDPPLPHRVWFIRPLLPEALPLDAFLRAEPEIPLRERLAILRRVAEALAALEAAGYRHHGVESRSVFFVPYPPIDAGVTEPNARTVVKNRRLFSVRASRPYHQELMGMADVRRAVSGEPDATVGDVVRLADDLGVLSTLPPGPERTIRQLGLVDGWARRARLLRGIEQHLDRPAARS